MKRHFFPSIFTQEEIGYSVRFPDLKGAFSEGDTMDEAYEMAVDAIGLYLLDGTSCTIPSKVSELSDIEVHDNEFLVLIEFDEINYMKKHANQSVKKTLSIPSWLNEMALQKNINFSQILQDALKNQLLKP